MLDGRVIVDVLFAARELGFSAGHVGAMFMVADEASLIEAVAGTRLDLVIDGGHLTADVSSVVSLIGDVPVVLRKGAGDVGWCG